MSLTKFPSQLAPKHVTYLPFQMEEFFHRSLDRFFGTDFADGLPSVNVMETPDAFELQVAAPGYNKSDFSVDVANETLTISASKEAETSEDGVSFRRREFQYGNFSRSFRLSDDVLDMGAIRARYENGMLFVNLPKKKNAKATLSRRIEIA
jgi:HSP20 family protein